MLKNRGVTPPDVNAPVPFIIILKFTVHDHETKGKTVSEKEKLLDQLLKDHGFDPFYPFQYNYHDKLHIAEFRQEIPD